MDLNRFHIAVADHDADQWFVWVPPLPDEAWADPTDLDSDQMGPYGASYWPSYVDAVDFVCRVWQDYPALRAAMEAGWTYDGRKVTKLLEMFS